jgi:hypothetical protein
MTATKPKSIGEKWVLYLVRHGSDKSAKYWFFAGIGFIIVFVYLFLITGNHDYIFFACIYFFIEIRSFEIRHFSRIIGRQKEQLDGYQQKMEECQGDMAG